MHISKKLLPWWVFYFYSLLIIFVVYGKVSTSCCKSICKEELSMENKSFTAISATLGR